MKFPKCQKKRWKFLLMNNQTFETLQKTKVRLTACVEVDKSLDIYTKAEIRDIIELIDRILDEAAQTIDTP